MSARNFLRLLNRAFGYAQVPGSMRGSHCWLAAPEHPRIRWAFGRRDLAPTEVRKVLVHQVGLTLEQAKEVARDA